jgi:hypothetical protein
MPPIAFLALLAIAMLPGAALRLELNFRRAGEAKGRPGSAPPTPRPELRAAPAGGYCQPPFSPALGKR